MTSARDEAVLDNVVWRSIDGPCAHLAQRRGLAGRFASDVSPFAAVADPRSPQAWSDMAELVGPGGVAFMFTPPFELPDGFAPMPGWDPIPCGQLVAGPATPPPAGEEFEALGGADVPEMLDLVGSTRPGPFSPRTIEFGGYIGRRVDGRLVAMGGYRLRCPGFTEISAICTADDHRGKGMATAIVLELVARIRARGEEAFLHVANSNQTARRLYETLGFTVRAEVDALALRYEPSK